MEFTILIRTILKIISLTLFLFTETLLLFDHKVFVNKDIKLNTPSSIIVHPRTDVWAYNDHRGRVIRMFNGNHYRIICENSLIYSKVIVFFKKSIILQYKTLRY